MSAAAEATVYVSFQADVNLFRGNVHLQEFPGGDSIEDLGAADQHDGLLRTDAETLQQIRDDPYGPCPLPCGIVYRDEYYLKNKMPKEGTEDFFKWQAEMEEVAGLAEVIVGKQRHGPTGTISLQFDADVTRFSNLLREDRLPHRMD